MYPSKRQITHADIQLGEPLAFSVYDVEGRLLLRKGIVITMPEQVERIVERRAVMGTGTATQQSPLAPPRPASPPRITGEASPVFEQVGSLILNLKHSFATVLKTPGQIELPPRIRQFAAKLQTLCAQDMDSALAAPHLDYLNPYIIVHQVMAAVLTELIARRRGMSESERLSFVCAALTRDLAQALIQTELDQCEGPLPEALKKGVLAHPLQSAEILRRAGVDDEIWLASVEQHHERLDGSGYPRALKATDIAPGARVLAIADTYSAMTKPRLYRNKGRTAQNALRDIYLQKDALLDGELIQAMIKEIGVLPPGSIVRLRNGEIAAVRHCTGKPSEAVVYTVYDQRGMPLMEPLRRDASRPEFEITAMVPFTECRSAAVTIKRLWTK
jgi:hypothetical protein